MSLLLHRSDGVAVIRGRGSVMTTEVRAAITRCIDALAPDGDVIIDLSGVREIDPGHARRLTELVTAHSQHREVVVVADAAQTRLALVLACLDLVVPLVDSRQDAVEILHRRRGTRPDDV